MRIPALAILFCLVPLAGHSQGLPEPTPESTPAEVRPPLAPLPSPEAAESSVPTAPRPLFTAEDAKTLSNFVLDETRLLRFEGVVKSLGEESQKDADLAAELDKDIAKEEGVEKWAESISKEKPKTLAVLKAGNLTPKEFVLISYSITMAMVYADLLKSNPLASVPSYVPRENISFVRKYEDRLAGVLSGVVEPE